MYKSTEIVLQTRFMGSLDCRCNDRSLGFILNADSKLSQLFIQLMYNADEGVSRNAIRESLYQDSDADFANSLKALMFRARKIFAQTLDLPEGDYIRVKDGIYRFSSNIVVDSDVARFKQNYYRAGELRSSEDERMACLAECCKIYRGELLMIMSNVPWVTFENALLYEMYSQAVRELSSYYCRRFEHEQAYQVFKRAAVFYPYEEEWAIGCITSLLAQGQFKKAMNEYEEISNALFDDLGVYPSEKLMDTIRKLSDKMAFAVSSAAEVNQTLKDEQVGGAYYCNYPSFVDSYRILKRIMSRDHIEATLVMFTVVGRDGKPLENTSEITNATSALRLTLIRTLRRSDMFTRFGKTQMLVMLWGMTKERMEIVINRIMTTLAKEDLDNSCRLIYSVLEAGEPPTPMPLSAADSQRRTWKRMRD